jgi:uncharacterized phiE125 gp8 family phage protein
MALNANALTTLAQAKSWLKIPNSETGNDSLIELLINGASDDAARYCDRIFKAQSHTQISHGRASNAIVLKQWPVNSITEVRIDQNAVFTDADTLLDPSEYTLGDEATAVYLINRLFPKGYNNVKIIYNAGYSTVPSSLEQATLWIIAFNYRIWETKNIARTSKSKEGESANYVQLWPDHIIAALNQFKRLEFSYSDAPMWNG